MNFRIKLAIVLILAVLLSIVCLQLLYNYNLYNTETITFKRQANEALKEAIKISRDQKRARTISALKSRLENPNFYEVKTVWKDAIKEMQFQLIEVHSQNENKQLSMSFADLDLAPSDFKGKEKEIFIPRFLETVDKDLQKDYMWYYTQDVGDFLIAQNKKDRISLAQIKLNLQKVLSAKGINTNFELNGNKQTKIVTETYQVEPDYFAKIKVYAAFPNVFSFYLKTQIWSIVGSLFLILIVFWAGIYLTRLLVTQEKLSKEKDALMSHISHELRTPITAIQISAEAMKSFDQTEEERQQYLDIILHKSRELSNFTHDILNELNLGKSSIIWQEVDIKSLFLKLKNEFQNDKVEISVESESLKIFVNEMHFENALRNIISNGIKYNQSPITKLKLRAKSLNNNALIEIQDNGIGIEDRYKKKIFDQFFRITDVNSKVYNVQGFGVGLSYVKRVMDLHKASIQVMDAVPQGSIFRIVLPNGKN